MDEGSRARRTNAPGRKTKQLTIGLDRDVWIAAIASSRKSLATRTAAIMCSFSGATCTSRVRHNADYVPYAKIRFDL